MPTRYHPLLVALHWLIGIAVILALFAGDAGALVAHLLAEDEIAADDLRRVQALIDETEDPDPRGEKS